MNPWQMAQQIKHELATITWPEGAAEVVFGSSVHVFAGAPNEDQIPPGFPWVLVGIDGGTADEDHPEFITQGFTLLSACNVGGDPLGEHAIIGGPVADLGSSQGRGTGEVMERVRAAVQDLTGIDGAKVLLSLSATGSPTPMGRGRHLVLDEHSLTALCTSALDYAAPQEFATAADTWTWENHAASRFDFLQYRITEKAGTTPPTTPSDGTVVYTGTAATASFSGSAASAFTVFADYNARGGSTVEGTSSAVVGATLLIP